MLDVNEAYEQVLGGHVLFRFVVDLASLMG